MSDEQEHPRQDQDDELDATLAAAARLLRREVPVRTAWRESLIESIEADARIVSIPAVAPGGRARVWSMRPPLAIAAGITLVALGAGGAVLGRSITGGHPTSAAQSTGATASVVPEQAVVRFVYVAPDARTVSIVGDFNAWNPRSVPLRRLSDGRTWIAELPLTPGRYAYAFSVDGVLKADPTAARGADDDFGVASSVVMVSGS